jgi:hypothetical protein
MMLDTIGLSLNLMLVRSEQATISPGFFMWCFCRRFNRNWPHRYALDTLTYHNSMWRCRISLVEISIGIDLGPVQLKTLGLFVTSYEGILARAIALCTTMTCFEKTTKKQQEYNRIHASKPSHSLQFEATFAYTSFLLWLI